jgi:low temperature requirement protein LtrA
MEGAAEGESRVTVTPLELFFDLVFVFAFTQVTGLMSADLTAEGVVRGMLVLAALWWAWAGYAWLTNTVDPDEGAERLAVLAVIGALLVLSLAVPDAFAGSALLFGVAYFAVRALHIVLYLIAGRDDPDLFRAVRRFAPTATLGPALILLAAFFDDGEQYALWIVALAIDYLGALTGRAGGWRVSPHHFAERHGLIVIIALGESIVAIGVGAAGHPIHTGVVVAALLGLAVAATLWWAYFDWVSIVAEGQLARATGVARAALARDVYSYIHLPMVAGIVLFALGLKKTIADFDDPLPTVAALALTGGVALYLFAHVCLRVRIGGGIGHGRPAAVLVLVALTPVSLVVSALVALACVAVVCTALIVYEVFRYRESRAQLRRTREVPDLSASWRA